MTFYNFLECQTWYKMCYNNFQMKTFLYLLPLVSLVLADGSNYQLLSLIDQHNTQGPHFLNLNNALPGSAHGHGSAHGQGPAPSAKSFQFQWRPSFYSRFSSFENSLHQVKNRKYRVVFKKCSH